MIKKVRRVGQLGQWKELTVCEYYINMQFD